MTAAADNQPTRFPTSLRLKVAVGVALPVLVILTGLSLLSYWRANVLMEEQIGAGVEELGQVTLGSLRHAMVRNEPARLLEILADVRQSQNVQRVEIIGLDGEVAASSDPEMVGQVLPQTATGCVDCHRIAPEQRPLTAQLAEEPGVLRVSSPIVNGPECTTCHSSQLNHLGMLLIDISVAGTQSRLLGDLKLNLGLPIGWWSGESNDLSRLSRSSPPAILGPGCPKAQRRPTNWTTWPGHSTPWRTTSSGLR